MAAVNSAVTPAVWATATDATAPNPGGSGQVSTPRYPGAIETYHGPPDVLPGGWTHGTAPSTPQAATVLPTADPERGANQAGIGEAAPYGGNPAPGMGGKPPNNVPGHDGYGGTAQVMARHGVDDGSAALFLRQPQGFLNISHWWNIITKRLPTDWRKIYGPTGQLENYTFDRPSINILPESDRDMVVHQVDYEASPIYLKLAQVAQAQGAPPSGGYRGVYGYEPDMAGGQFTANEGNPVYDSPPDPATIPVNPEPVNYGLSMLYG